jgi:hypothetical protein
MLFLSLTQFGCHSGCLKSRAVLLARRMVALALVHQGRTVQVFALTLPTRFLTFRGDFTSLLFGECPTSRQDSSSCTGLGPMLRTDTGRRECFRRTFRTLRATGVRPRMDIDLPARQLRVYLDGTCYGSGKGTFLGFTALAWISCSRASAAEPR